MPPSKWHYTLAAPEIPNVSDSVEVPCRKEGTIFLEREWVDFPCMTLLNEKTFLVFQIPKSPSFVIRCASNMFSQWMIIYIVDDILMTTEDNTLLKFEFGVQTPHSYFSVSRTSSYVWTVFRKVDSRVRMKLYAVYSISVPSELSSYFTIREPPHFADTAPATSSKKFFIWR